ncbi:MAG: hypothetical protein ACOX6T_04155 [Myxococcales bacterium]|jgi:outer membrane protein assembly factor BamE (lipoprotein component of BamABCDE complex)
MNANKILGWGFALLLSVPAYAGNDYAGKQLYTLVNLHPDEKNARLSSVNYQLDALLPLCTKVQITSMSRKGMKIKLVESGREYDYEFHKTLREGIDAHIAKVFGEQCPEAKVKSLSKIDQEGIRDGRVYDGMTKEGVILAVGYPPEHATPNLGSNEWLYWQNRFVKNAVRFVDGKVSSGPKASASTEPAGKDGFKAPEPVAAPKEGFVAGAELVTLVNLHPDEKNQRLYSVNYQLEGLLPRCTKVRVKSINKKAMKFTLVDSGRDYEYLFHETLREDPETHLAKYFGAKCDATAKLSKVDQTGIRDGRAIEGMSKQGVILAIGYPPEHATPSLDSNEWTYWKNRFGKLIVRFADGKVTEVRK